MFIRRFVLGIVFVCAMVWGASAVYGQDYPNRPIRIVTGAVGGGSDFTARQIAQGISSPLGQPVVVDNRGSGIVLYEFLFKAPPDGYGLVVSGSNFWTTPLMQKVPYDVERDSSPISLISREVWVFTVHPSVPAKSIKELIALAKARPGELNNAITTVGGPSHLASELFKAMAGVNIVNVNYKGGATGMTALISGEVQLRIADAGPVAPHVKSGRVRALAVTSATPSALAPGLPTVAASGLPGYEYVGMTGIWAPAKTPGAIVNRLNHEIVRVLNVPETKERFLSSGSEIVANSPEEFAAIIKSDIAKIGKLIKDAGIKVE